MANQTTIAGYPRKPPSRWFAKRSRMTGVLLFGWLAFWITTIVNPCCNAFAIGPADGSVRLAPTPYSHDVSLFFWWPIAARR